ncbi:MAG: TIGR03067 domain-containing protein [Gemmataceae bacterium]|nr:TIGR03067 domain-containing protein [Gemmataceae bacterium]
MFLTKVTLGTGAVLGAVLVLAAVGGTLVPTGSAQDAKSLTSQAIETAAKGVGRAEDAAAEDAKLLQGEWRSVEYERDGKKRPSYEVMSRREIWNFKGDEVSMKSDGGGLLPGTRFKLDPSKSPKVIDITWFEGPVKGQTAAGIYALEKGRLWLCIPLPSKTPASAPPNSRPAMAMA